MKKKAISAIGSTIAVIAIISILIAIIMSYYGYIQLPNFNKYTDGVNTVVSDDKCPKTSEGRGQPCCKQLQSGEMQAAVSIIYVPNSCKKCPDDTHFKDPAPEGGYMLCECNACTN